MPEPTYLTAEGFAKLKAELEDLKGPKRDELAARLRDAIQMGDLSENADYHKAKEDQGFLEGRIQELEYSLSNAVIINEAASKKDEVAVGSHVTIQEIGFEPEMYQLVGSRESDPRKGAHLKRIAYRARPAQPARRRGSQCRNPKWGYAL